MEKEEKIELLKKLQEAGNRITQGYHEQTGNDRIRFKVLQLLDNEESKLCQGTDIIRKAAQLYDEYEGNEEYIHIPDVQQMLENFKNHIVLGIEDTKTGELEGVTTIKYFENDENKTNPYYPRKNAKCFEVTGVIVKQRKNMRNKGLGTGMYETAFLGIEQFVKEHPEEGYRLNAVIDCTNIRSLYAAQNAINNLNSRELLGKNKKMKLNLGGIYVVRDEQTKKLAEAPTFVIESDLQEIEKKNSENEREKGVAWFRYSRPKNNDEKYMVYRGIKHSVLLSAYKARRAKIQEAEKQRGYKLANSILGEVSKSSIKPKKERNLDKEAGYVDYLDLSDFQISIDEMRLDTNGTEKVGTKRIPRRDVDKFIGPMPKISMDLEER